MIINSIVVKKIIRMGSSKAVIIPKDSDLNIGDWVKIELLADIEKEIGKIIN